MNNREIKFRTWHKELEDMSFSTGNESAFWSKVTLYQDMYDVMQFTGLTDKNNKEIYEGDIIAGDAISGGVIEFNPGTCCYIIRRSNNTFIRLEARKDSIEIIGNIYEPEIQK